MIKKCWIVMLCGAVLFLFVGCGSGAATAMADSGGETVSADVSKLLFSNETLLKEIYSLSDPDYRVYESRLVDLYLISCALYFDFDSQELLPHAQENALYHEAVDYFSPHKNHPLIQALGPYVDMESHAQRNDVVNPLLMYAFSKVDYGLDVNMVQTDAFQNGEEFNAFLRLLQSFYLETNAEAFFQSAELQAEMAAYLKKELDQWPVAALFSEMEAYVGNKDELYPEQAVKYRSVMTLYQPFNASFHSVYFGDAVYLIGQQSPTDISKRPDRFDIGQTINTTIHEFLHNYINQPVAAQSELIGRLTARKEKSDYADDRYNHMEWPRIVDENLVRVLETAIFRRALGDEVLAYDLILKKEIQFAGMPRLQDLYDALALYENDRGAYPAIDDYLPQLIAVMFR